MSKELWRIVAYTPKTRRGRIAFGVGNALLIAASAFPTIAFDLGFFFFAIYVPLAVAALPVVLWFDRLPDSRSLH